MKALTFLIHLDESVLATQPYGGEANSAVSFLYVPGSMLRGALIHAYQRGKEIDDLLTDDQAWQLFFNGHVQFLNAYLAHPRSKKRMLPTPRSWFVEKEDVVLANAEMHDFAIKINTEFKKPKPPEGGSFTLISGETAYLSSPGIQMTVHNTSENRDQKNEGESQVYRYEALSAGQTLAGAILSPDKAQLELLQKLLEDERVLLGGSHTGGYGCVTITDCQIQENWQEYQPETPSSGATTLTLLSDTVLRGNDGHISAQFFEALGLKNAKDDQGYQAYQRLQLVGGFNRKWGLPLPQAWALSAGSVFRFPTNTLNADQLAAMIENGIGERRNEGFGRIAVNWHTRPSHKRTELPPPIMGPLPKLSPESHKLAFEMATRRLRLQLDEELIRAITRYRGRFEILPKPAQLSRVRVAARTATLTGDTGTITRHLENLKGAKTEWMAARIGKKSLFEWVKEYSQLSEEKFKEVFGLTAGLSQVGGVAAKISSEIINEYNLRLVDGVMKLAIEQQKDKSNGGGGA